jgi:hypothetical protein
VLFSLAPQPAIELAPATPSADQPPPLTEIQKSHKPRAKSRPATGIERAVRRTLSEPHRRQPLVEMAARLRQDAHQTGSRTMPLLGIGPQSDTHEPALHVATVLAEEGGNLLLIDADPARRQLSTDLDALQEPGLADLAREGLVSPDLLLPTAQEGLAFLAAGSQRFPDLEDKADLLSRAFGQLAAEFDLILLAGGRTDDPAAATLARLCDATYVVIELGTVEANYAQKSLRTLRSTGARVLGCIATGATA